MTSPAAELIGAREACQVAGISRSTLTYWMLTGRLRPAQTIPGPSGRASSHLFARADVESARDRKAAS